jgi:hypothetical protein
MFVEEKRSGEVQEVSFEGLLAFAERQPGDKWYDYGNSNICPCAQYAESIGKMEEWRGTLPEIWQKLDSLVSRAVHFEYSVVRKGAGSGAVGTFGRLADYMRHERYITRWID